MPWRRETDKRRIAIHAELHRLLTEALSSGQKGEIVIKPIAYWPNGLGTLEAGRTVKIDLQSTIKNP